mmetsp:Transcript_30540/g.101592  ORF Transcript_30540/g.101592 Transcript_30540/m.101592 type:complete len:183 (+) Transcript_30540:730-1278(+)
MHCLCLASGSERDRVGCRQCHCHGYAQRLCFSTQRWCKWQRVPTTTTTMVPAVINLLGLSHRNVTQGDQCHKYDCNSGGVRTGCNHETIAVRRIPAPVSWSRAAEFMAALALPTCATSHQSTTINQSGTCWGWCHADGATRNRHCISYRGPCLIAVIRVFAACGQTFGASAEAWLAGCNGGA